MIVASSSGSRISAVRRRIEVRKESAMQEVKPISPAQIEHDRLRKELEKATTVGGETADAARAVSKVLAPHMLLEEEFAMPPLKLLPRLSRGEFTPEMERILTKTDTLKALLPRMLEEHTLIVAALRRLLQAAIQERHEGYASFAQKLIHHAQQEEEVFYPASILVGEYIKLRLERQ
jgi:hemerythrin superfamily protein